jgi:hypothetical protein
MAEFKKISDVDVVEKLTNEDSVLIVDAGGALKQTPAANVGGGKTLTIVAPGFEQSKSMSSNEALFEFWTSMSEEAYLNSYITNMPFNEALTLFRNCELTNCIVYVPCAGEFVPMRVMSTCTLADVSNDCTCDCLHIRQESNEVSFNMFWTADGFTWDMPLKVTEK